MTRDTEVIVCTLGTRGDILPFVALADRFVASGHKVSFLSNRNWRTLVESAGMQFHAIADEDPSQSGRDDAAFYRASTYPSFAKSFAIVQQKLAENPRCVVIYRLNMLGAECAAEKFRLPGIKVALQPGVIPSCERPPWPLTQWAYGPASGVVRRAIIPAIYRAGALLGRQGRRMNRFRKTVGLPGFPWGQTMQGEDLFLMLCPEWFAMPQKDWPGTLRTAGFLFRDAPGSDSAAEAFIRERGAPIVFTPGTGVTDVAAFHAHAEALCAALNLPGLFLSPAMLAAKSGSSSSLLVRDFVDLGWLLPRARMLVHHGGIGSAAQAMRAGIPQLVFPDRFDQPDNALRIATLGLGGAVFSRRPDMQAVSEMAGRILSSEAVGRQVAHAATLIAAWDCAGFCHDMIADIAARRFAPEPSEAVPLRRAV